ncbi:MAG: hypothetical protein GF372_03930 [Candidatus Marinimicrobia bacterium]|nr:hypothetical protein [Candidatus Neomarinimicrobiota bacterium]
MNPVDFPQGFFDIWIRGDESPWYHITPTVGLRYTPILNEKFQVFIGSQVGGIIGISPQITTDVRVNTSYFNTSYQRAGYSYSYNWNPFFGIRFFEHFEIKGEYLLAGMMEYEVTILNYNGVYQQRFFTVPAQFFNILLTYTF